MVQLSFYACIYLSSILYVCKHRTDDANEAYRVRSMWWLLQHVQAIVKLYMWRKHLTCYLASLQTMHNKKVRYHHVKIDKATLADFKVGFPLQHLNDLRIPVFGCQYSGSRTSSQGSLRRLQCKSC